MSSLWLTKDTARLILAHTDLATTWALALTCKLLCKEIRDGALLLKRAEGRLLDFQPKRQEELSVKTALFFFWLPKFIPTVAAAAQQ